MGQVAGTGRGLPRALNLARSTEIGTKAYNYNGTDEIKKKIGYYL